MNDKHGSASDKDTPIAGHEYDGIRELDNDLPRWWLYIFYVSIVFSAGYGYYYHLGGPGKSPARQFEDERAAFAAAVGATTAASAPGAPGSGTYTSEELNAYAAKDAGARDKGKQLYVSKCIACHGASGQGVVGPNLTDKFWLHGGKVERIAQVISDGVTDKGMIAWKSQMSREEIMQMALFVRSLQGTNPPGAKPPQGNEEP